METNQIGEFFPIFGSTHMAVGQNQWYHFGVGAPPILEPTLDWDVHGGYDLDFDHGHVVRGAL